MAIENAARIRIFGIVIFIQSTKKAGYKSGLFCFISFGDYPPKSSNLTFSGGTPQSSHILTTALFIIGGPQK